MHIELRNNDTLVISQALFAHQSTEVNIRFECQNTNSELEQLTEEQKKSLISRLFICNDSISLLEIENQLSHISIEYPQWNLAKHQLLAWLSEYHGSLRKSCLETICDSSTRKLSLVCWQVEKICNQFEQLNIHNPQVSAIYKQLIVVTYQELLKLYERLKLNDDTQNCLPVYKTIISLINKRDQVSIWRYPRAFSEEMIDNEIIEFAPNWVPYRNQVLSSQRHNPWMKYSGIALSSMCVMSLVTIATYQLHYSAPSLSAGLVFAICITYGIRDVIKDILKENLYKLFSAIRPEQRYKIYGGRQHVKRGEYRTLFAFFGQNRSTGQYSDIEQNMKVSGFEVKDDLVASNLKLRHSTLYTETHIHLDVLNIFKRTSHFRVIDDQGNSYKARLDNSCQIKITISSRASTRSPAKHTYLCVLGSTIAVRKLA